MRTPSQPVVLLSLLLMLLAAAAAVADDMLTIRIYNDGSDDIVVTVYDMNAQPPGAVLASQRINGFAWIPVSVTAGAVGNGHVMWSARTADASFHRCGHEERRRLANDESVRVSADSQCIRNAR
jgi:hypothetical protein